MWHVVDQGVNMTALREIKLLRELSSPHFVRLLDVFHHKVNLCLVSLGLGDLPSGFHHDLFSCHSVS